MQIKCEITMQIKCEITMQIKCEITMQIKCEITMQIIEYVHEFINKFGISNGNLLSFLLRYSTRPYEWGTQWEIWN